MKIFITRHGETEWNTKGILQGHLDSPLTRNGIEGAYKLSKRLKDYEFDYIITSPLYRAYKTAEIISEPNNTTIVKDDSLKEINCGEFQGYNFKDIWLKFPELKRQMDSDPVNFIYPNGESLSQFYKRVVLGFTDILNKYENSKILIVGHGGTIKCLMASMFEHTKPKIFFENVVVNCSLTEIDYDKKKFTLVKFNDTDHL